MNSLKNQGSHFMNGMLRPYEPLLMTLLRVIDAISGVVLFLGFAVYFKNQTPHIKEAVIFIFFVSLVSFHSVGIYRSWRFSSMGKEIFHIFCGCLILYSFLFLLSYFLNISEDFPKNVVISWIVSWPIYLSTERILIRFFLRHYRRKGHNLRKAVIAGSGEMAEQLAQLISKNPWSGTQIMGFFDDRARSPITEVPFLGDFDLLPKYAQKNNIDIVYIALSERVESKIKELLNKLSDSTISIFIIPDLLFLDLILGGSLIFFENFPVIALRDTPIRGINVLIKRMIDFVLASFILIVMSPFLILIVIRIKFTSSGPVLFKQWRYGLDGRPILIYKFRTMTVCEDGYEFTQATKNDCRVTRFGSFLRRYSLDEIPQLINVCQGRMSLVGPRPHPVAMNEEYRKLVPGYMLRHKVKPGITGLAQLNGFRGETDTLGKMKKRVEYDLEYLRRWSIFLDISIIVKTLLNGAWLKNAY